MESVFKALADPTRRDLLDALRREDGQTLSQLEAALPISRFGVAKHLKALEAAGLVTRVRRGRFTHHYLNAVPIAEALMRWIEPYTVAPAVGAMLNLKARLEGQMTDKPDFVTMTFIRCTQDALWDALTDASALAAYTPFAERVERKGDELIYYLPDGGEMLVLRETRLDPKSRIESTFEPKWAPGIPPSRYVYLIEPEGDHCKLTLEHYGIGQEAGIAEGWARELSGLKTYLETGAARSFPGEMEAAQ